MSRAKCAAVASPDPAPVEAHDFRVAPFSAPLSLQGGRFGGVEVKRVKIGMLALASGRVVATDPVVMPEQQPFRRTVPKGRFPVHVSVANGATVGGQRVAFATLKFAKSRPVRWELALTTGQKASALEAADQFFGYPVDAGMGCFMDATTAKLISRRARDELAKDPYFNYFDNIIDAELYCRGAPRDWTDHRPYPDKAGNCLIFSSGLGDGLYASYFGLDASNFPVCLVTDFRVLDVMDHWLRKAKEKERRKKAKRRAPREPHRPGR